MITEWLSAFKEGWTGKNVDFVLDLFTDDVEYWETPYQRIQGKDALKQEWNAVHDQKDIRLDLEVFSSASGRHTVFWKLSYKNEQSEVQNWAGAYLVELNSEGKCTYFYQVGEKQ